MNAREKISFVIPCYRSEKTIIGVVDELRQEMDEHCSFDYEIILISDSSPDHVYQIICQLAEKDPHIIGAELARNFGQHAALMAGYRMAEGDYVVSLDDDGQIPVEQTFSLIEKLKNGYDVAYAAYENNTRGIFRSFGTMANDYMADVLLQKPKELQITSFFAMKKFVRDEVIHYEAPYPYVAGLVLRSTKNFCNVPAHLRPRQDGRSGYTLSKLLSLWVNGFTAFSVKPLRIATAVGSFCALIGFAYGLYIIIHKFLYPLTPAGYSSLMAVLLFIGGLIMVMLGLIGEYIGRIYISLNAAPQYVIRDTTSYSKSSISENYLPEIYDN